MHGKTVYLDNAATTRVDPRVVDAMLPYFSEKFGNAAAQYYEYGRQARTALEAARAQLASLIGASPEEIFFTAGATESNNWVIQATALAGKKKHILTAATEHHAVLEPVEWFRKNGFCESTVLPVDSTGKVNPDDLRRALGGASGAGLVTIMYANNEIGTLNDIPALAKIAKEAGAVFHTDATQAVGKIPVNVDDLGVDALSLSAHKFHGPKGVGALYLRKGTRLPAYIHGGGQENNRRAGTSNVPGAVGMGRAAELAAAEYIADGARQSALVEKAWAAIAAAIPKIHRNGHPSDRVPNILSLCVEGAEGEAILGYLDMSGVQVSSGSACTSGSLDPSHVLLACGVPVERAHGSIRASLSHETTDADMDAFVAALPKVVERLRLMSVTWKG